MLCNRFYDKLKKKKGNDELSHVNDIVCFEVNVIVVILYI